MYARELVVVLREILEKTTITPFIWGEAGIGKSQIVHQVGGELGLKVVELRIGQMEVGDLIGIPYQEGGRTKWAAPEWFPSDLRADPPTLVFCDELNRGEEHSTLQAIFQFVSDRRLHAHVLRECDRIVCAGNPSAGEYMVADLDAALMDRFVHLVLHPSVDDWMVWAESVGINEQLKDFVGTNQSLLFQARAEDFDVDVKPSPRSYEMLNEVMTKCSLPKELFPEVAAGLIGKEAAIVLARFLEERSERPISPREILFDYDRVRDRLLSSRPDILNASITHLIAYCASERNEINGANLLRFILDLPNDFKFAVLRGLMRCDPARSILTASDELVDLLSAAFDGVAGAVHPLPARGSGDVGR